MAITIQQAGNAQAAGQATDAVRLNRTGRDMGFTDVLRMRVEADAGVAFSAHARERIQSRGISLDTEQTVRLGAGIDLAAAKGGKDSLVLVDDTAFIVSVPNRTVVTALSGEQLRGTVFTNIDSTVLA